MTSLLHLGIGGHVVGLRAADGVEVWRRHVGFGHIPVRVVRSEDVVVAIGTSGLFCFDAATGQQRWHAVEPGIPDADLGVFGGVVVFARAGEVRAFDRATGARLWANNLKGLGLGRVNLATGTNDGLEQP